MNEKFIKTYNNVTKAGKNGDIIFKKEYKGIADILNRMFEGNIKTGYSHSKFYWSKANKLEHETIAEYGRTYYNNGKEVTELFETLFPETLSKINSLLEDIKCVGMANLQTKCIIYTRYMKKNSIMYIQINTLIIKMQ